MDSKKIRIVSTIVVSLFLSIVWLTEYNAESSTIIDYDNIYQPILRPYLLSEDLFDSRFGLHNIKPNDMVYKKVELKEKTNIHNTILQYGFLNMPYEHRRLVIEECRKYKIDPDLIFGLIFVESRFNEKAVSRGNSSRGYGQIIKSTGNYLFGKLFPNHGKYNHDLALKAKFNIPMCIYYLNSNIKSHKGNIERALIRYNGNGIGKKYPQLVFKAQKEIKEQKKNFKKCK